jgi:hypothetical protein
MKTTKLILTLSVIIALVSAVLLVITLDKYGITGRATDTAYANLTISASASITFTDDTCDFGAGAVDEVPDFASIYTGNTSTVNGSWTACNGLTATNDGNVNLTVDFKSDVLAASFIGGTSPEFKWIASGASCVGVAGITSLTDVTLTDQNACDNLSMAGTIDLDFGLKIPENAIGTHGAVITATGTAVA